MIWWEIIGWSLISIVFAKIFLNLIGRKKRKFIAETFQHFYYFADSALIPRDRVSSLFPQSNASKKNVLQVYQDGMKPIDGAMVMADMCVVEALQRMEYVKNSEQQSIGLPDKQNDLLTEMLPAWAEGILKDAQKLQFAAFEHGPRLGSMVTLQAGSFKGRFNNFTEPA